jgi:hypothetical protein
LTFTPEKVRAATRQAGETFRPVERGAKASRTVEIGVGGEGERRAESRARSCRPVDRRRPSRRRGSRAVVSGALLLRRACRGRRARR